MSDTVDQGVTFLSEAPPVSGINPQTKNDRPLTAPAVTRTACSNKSTITGKALIINPPLLVSSRCAGVELEPHTTQPVSRRLDPKPQRSGAKTIYTDSYSPLALRSNYSLERSTRWQSAIEALKHARRYCSFCAGTKAEGGGGIRVIFLAAVHRVLLGRIELQ